jgi:hypothetical protein
VISPYRYKNLGIQCVSSYIVSFSWDLRMLIDVSHACKYIDACSVKYVGLLILLFVVCCSCFGSFARDNCV